jgi:hypothetical protein
MQLHGAGILGMLFKQSMLDDYRLPGCFIERRVSVRQCCYRSDISGRKRDLVISFG